MMLPAIVARLPRARRRDVVAPLRAAVASARRDPALFAWRAATAPLWVASDIPMPGRPTRQAGSWGALEDVAAGPGRYVRETLETLLRRYRWSWLLTAALRGVALGLWLALVWTLLALATGVATPNRWWIAGLMVTGLVFGLAFGVLNRPTPLRLGRSLDATFRLHERLTTALDPALADVHVPARQLQYADTANGLADIRSEFTLGSFIPFREVFVALIAGLLLLAAFFANVPGGDLPPAASGAVPPFASAADRLAVQQTPPAAQQQALPQETPAPDTETLEQAETSNQTRMDLDALGDALSDYALTRPAANAIAAGNYGQAADDLRTAAENADSLSPDAREALANDLDQAASQMSPANPALAQAARDTADSLRSDDGTAGDQLNNLADQVDQAGDQVAPNSQIAAGPPDSSSSAPPGSAGSSSSQDSASQQSQPQGEGSGNSASAAGDPGSGSAAQPGLSNREVDAGNQQSQSGSSGGEQNGQGGQAAADSPSQERGSSGSQGDASGQAGAQEASGDTGSGGSPGTSDQANQDQANASQGSGAGGEGETQTTGQEQQGGPGGDQTSRDRQEADTAQQGQADQAPPSGGEGTGNAGDTAPSGRNSLILEGTSDENLPSGMNTGTSSVGSGSGATAASGSATGAPVGEAGPDSNRVPPEYRDYVENYFNRERP